MESIPAYLNELSKAPLRYENVVDLEIVKRLFQVDQRIQKTFEEVCNDISHKKSIDYVGSYELMKHDKLKRECFRD